MNEIELKEELDSIIKDICKDKYFMENIEGNIIFSDKENGKVQFDFNGLKDLNTEDLDSIKNRLDIIKEFSDYKIREKGSIVFCEDRESRHSGYVFSNSEYLYSYKTLDSMNLDNNTYFFLPKGIEAYKMSVSAYKVEDEGNDTIDRYFTYYKANENGGHESESMTERQCRKALKQAEKEFKSEEHIYLEF